MIKELFSEDRTRARCGRIDSLGEDWGGVGEINLATVVKERGKKRRHEKEEELDLT